MQRVLNDTINEKTYIKTKRYDTKWFSKFIYSVIPYVNNLRKRIDVFFLFISFQISI